MKSREEILAESQLLIKIQEGYSSQLYKDTVGKLTIGYGRNIEDNGIRQDEANLMFQNDYNEAVQELHRLLPWTEKLDIARHEVLVNMLFNMGWGNGKRGLSTFVTTLRYIKEGKYEQASQNMLNSKWATQVGRRAGLLARIMKTGVWE